MSTAASWPRVIALVAGEPREVPAPAGARGMHEPLAGLPNGVYSGLRTFPGARFLALEAHLDRAERSARALETSLATEREALVRALQRLADEAAPLDLALRFDVLPEPAELGGARSRAWIAAALLQPVPARLLEAGVGVERAPADLVRPRPLVKTTDFVLRRQPYPLALPEAYEHLMLDTRQGVLEGTSSSFFVVQEARLVTAGSGVLEGITRAVVLELASTLGLTVELEPPRTDALGAWDEAFLTSSTRGVVPVVRALGQRIGEGRPGPWTRRLMEAYGAHVEREARRAVPAAAADRGA